MNTDYYNLLGLEKNASKDEIKKAFHKLARKYHPDNKTSGDEDKFKEVNEAYQTLSDDKKRSEYDTYGHVFSGAGGNSTDPGFHQDFQGFDIGDIFNEFFGGGGNRMKRGRDISIDVEVPFTEAIYGTERTMLLTKTSLCDLCKGNGAKPGTQQIKCEVCNGKGKVHETRSSFLGSFTSVRECGTCKGEGKIPKEKCDTCHGLGIGRKQEEIVVKIPPGIQDGEVIRLSGMGEAVSHGVPGDLYVKIHVGQHPLFRRDGENLVMDLDIKLSDALLGGEYPIQLVDNSQIKLKVPAGVSLGEVMRVRGKGVLLDRSRKGDLLIKLNIKLPRNLSKKARKLFEELKEEGI